MTIEPYLIVSESLHWYCIDGPCKEVPRATPKKLDDGTILKTKAPTLREAKLYGLFPSVSALSNWGPTNRGIMNYKRNLWVDMTINAYQPYMTKEQWKQAVVDISDGIEEAVTDRGTQMHRDTGKALKGEDVDTDEPTQAAISNIQKWLEGVETDETERWFANAEHGIGGTIDFVSHGMIADWKTKMAPESYRRITSPYDSHIIQISAYAELTGHKGDCCLVYVCSTTGAIKPFTVTAEQRRWAWACFLSTFETWKLLRKYDPLSVKNWTLKEIMGWD